MSYENLSDMSKYLILIISNIPHVTQRALYEVFFVKHVNLFQMIYILCQSRQKTKSEQLFDFNLL